jgi:hypothetical protein
MKLGEIRTWSGWNRLARYKWHLAVMLAVLTALWWVPKRQVAYLKSLTPEQLFDRENEARKTLAQIMGGIVVLLGAYYTWRSVQQTERAQRASEDNAQKSREISQQGQITDRFTRAIAQLGDDKMEIKLGGIFALERIARDSERDHQPIMEVLTSYLRQHAPWTEDEPSTDAKAIPRLREDIQAALTVIGRAAHLHGRPKLFLDFRGIGVQGAILDEPDFSSLAMIRTDFSRCSLTEAKFRKTALVSVRFCSSVLARADFSGASLEGADLRWADLTEADFRNATLHEAMLGGAKLSEADLRGADLTGASGLTQEQIKAAKIDETTKLPTDLGASERPKPEAES